MVHSKKGENKRKVQQQHACIVFLRSLRTSSAAVAFDLAAMCLNVGPVPSCTMYLQSKQADRKVERLINCHREEEERKKKEDEGGVEGRSCVLETTAVLLVNGLAWRCLFFPSTSTSTGANKTLYERAYCEHIIS